ncbi:MAG: fatty acid desaturase family protein [Solirubrobacterales bacterium]
MTVDEKEKDTTVVENPLDRLSAEQLEQLAEEFDALHDEVFEDLGDRDRVYITSIIKMERQLIALGRALLTGSRHKPAWIAGTAALGAAKILENMEIGHNVMHGQWDWMNDPQIHSSTWDWDSASSAEAWKHSHNYIHHTYTNILGKDKDLGYEIMRIDPHQKWHPVYLAQPIYNLILMGLFEWGVAFHDLDLEALREGEKSPEEVLHDLKGIWGKARDQIVKDYVGWPLVSALATSAAVTAWEARGVAGRSPSGWKAGGTIGRWARRRNRRRVLAAGASKGLAEGARTFKTTVAANATANVVRNLWSYSIIFCGHFPDQTYVYTQDEVADETRGGWYVRQLSGAANITGGDFFHVMSGNLGYQVEHHLYPDMPSSRYSEIAPRVKEICERYELPYNAGPFGKQLGMVHRTIIRLAFPGGKPREKPGPYKGGDGDVRPTTVASNGGTHGLRTSRGNGGPDRSQDGVRVSIPD